jgi:hypothetical protein
MEKLNCSQVQLYFKFGQVRGTYMSVHVNGIDVVPDSNEQAMVELCVDFPCELLISLEGKDNNVDTVVDSDGKIIQDKFVQLTEARVDRVIVDHNFLQKWPVVSDSFATTYFGFNGQVSLKFNEPTGFHWLLKTKH